MNTRRFLLAAAVFGWGLSCPAAAQTVIFDFDTATPALSIGQSVPIQQTAGGITALFSSPNGPVFSIQSDSSTGFRMSKFSGKYLYDNNLNRNTLAIQFDRQLTAISFAFATADFQQVEVPTTLQLSAYVDTSSTTPLGTATAHGTYGSDTMPMGRLTYDSAGKPFTVVTIVIPYQAMGATDFFVDNITVTPLTAASPLATVSAASYTPAQPLAPGSIASGFGTNLAVAALLADTVPLPTTLGGVTVLVKDGAGRELPAPLFYVSPDQINYLVPPDCAFGQATVSVVMQGTTVATGGLVLEQVAPGLFSKNSDGKGVAAGVAVRVAPGGAQTELPVHQCGAAAGSCVTIPVDFGGPDNDLILVLFGTGIRGVSAPAAVTATLGGVASQVTYAGPQPQYTGLDQVNVRVPRSLAGRGDIDIVVTVDGKQSNTVTANIL